jgi:hypothetical protein
MVAVAFVESLLGTGEDVSFIVVSVSWGLEFVGVGGPERIGSRAMVVVVAGVGDGTLTASAAREARMVAPADGEA